MRPLSDPPVPMSASSSSQPSLTTQPLPSTPQLQSPLRGGVRRRYRSPPTSDEDLVPSKRRAPSLEDEPPAGEVQSGHFKEQSCSPAALSYSSRDMPMLQAPDASLLPPSASSTPAIAPDATPASRTPESARSARPAPRKRTRQAPSCSYLPRADDHVILIWVMALPLIVATGFPLLPDTRRHVREVMCLSDADLAALASKSARPRALGTYLNWSALRRAYVHLKGSPLLQRIRAFSAAHSEMTLRGSHACDGCTGPVGVGLQCSCGSTWHTACAVASLPSAEQLIVPQTSF